MPALMGAGKDVFVQKGSVSQTCSLGGFQKRGSGPVMEPEGGQPEYERCHRH